MTDSVFCVVVQGGTTLFVLEEGDVSLVQKVYIDTIESGMRSDNYLSAHPAIVKITYMEDEVGNDDDDNGMVFPIIEKPVGVSSTLGSRSWSYIALGGVVALLFLAVAMKHQRSKWRKWRTNVPRGDDLSYDGDSKSGASSVYVCRNENDSMISFDRSYYSAGAVLMDNGDDISLQDVPLDDEVILSNAGDENKANHNVIWE